MLPPHRLSPGHAQRKGHVKGSHSLTRSTVWRHWESSHHPINVFAQAKMNILRG